MTARPRSSEAIEVVGGDANNLKNVDVAFPLGRISVVTGVSGSGKSSLLADTLAAEGARRTRLFLGATQDDLERDDVRAFVGRMPPTVLVGQRGFQPSVRTTVGTATGFLSVLRRLFVLASKPYSERARAEVPPPSAETYSRWIAKHYRGTAEVWATPIRNERTDGRIAVRRLASKGIEQLVVRSETDPASIREAGRSIPTTEFKPLNPNVRHTIEASIGEIEVNGPGQRKALRKMLELAFAASKGSVVVMLPESSNPDLMGPFGARLDSTKHWVHPETPGVFAPPSPHLLSFNAPDHELSGACTNCHGTGVDYRLDEESLVSRPERSMRDGAFAIWTEKNYKYVNVQHETIEGLRGMHRFSPDIPWSKLSDDARALVLGGSGDEPVFDRDASGRKIGRPRPFAGFEEIVFEKVAGKTKAGERLGAFVEVGPCSYCGGTRWSFQARALRVGRYGIAEILAMTFRQVLDLTADQGDLVQAVPREGVPFVRHLRRHASSLISVGLGYLTGDRSMIEVSKGESRRVRLARVLDAGERGLCLLLDEPARGLHESDLAPLAAAFDRLRDDHTVILNEHRETLWEAADWLVELGPGAASKGGEVVYAGPRRNWPRPSGEDRLRQPSKIARDHPKIEVCGASIYNLEDVDCEIPLGRLTCICGVSGSGKSSFLRGVLAPALLQEVGDDAEEFSLRRGRWKSISGLSSLQEIVALDQATPPANRRSLVATFSSDFDAIRKTFGSSPAARRERLSPSDFGVNAGNGRCPVCAGLGEVEDGSRFSVCPRCGGSRYTHEVLSVRVAGTNVQELLEMPVDRLGRLVDTFGISEPLISGMCDLGIGYVALGRRLDSLSGGEVQRLRLAMHLSGSVGKHTIYLLDEPAVGLHREDVRRLASALERLLEDGANTIVMVEHDLSLIRAADWVLEFGPGSGPNGGQIVFSGPPGRLEKAPTPTGRALAGKLPKPEKPAGSRPRVGGKKLSVPEQVSRTRSLLRTLIQGDGVPQALAEDGLAEPVVVLYELAEAGAEAWEVAGLDLELPKLLLDLRKPPGEAFDDLLAEWEIVPGGWLAIHPFLTDLQVWGVDLPQSVVKTTEDHLSKEGLRLVTEKGEPWASRKASLDVRRLRATGDRLVPKTGGRRERAEVLRDAFAVGSRYVELRDAHGRLVAASSERLLDLERGLVGPMAPVPVQFSRLEPAGRCLMCGGRRTVRTLDEALVVANRRLAPEEEGFLTPQANAVMKGVRRNELKPFLSRMAREGLWTARTPFERLDGRGRELILYGFWSRPGPGSFLKKRGSNPAQVSSWLRWDGLFRRLLDESQRSPDDEWARSLQESSKETPCPRCEATGFRRYARLLALADSNLAEWASLRDEKRKLGGLCKLKPATPRQKRTLERLLDCLAPLASSNRSRPLEVTEAAVKAFTTMPAARAEGSASE